MTDKRAETYDAKAYDVCAPWAGQRGDKFIRQFAPSDIARTGTAQVGRTALFVMELGEANNSTRQYCNMDTGTSKPASGCRTRFPTCAIKVRNPGINVRVASGTRLPVEFIGVMVLQLHECVVPRPAQPPPSPHAPPPSPRADLMDKLGFIVALYVPGMPHGTTLVSPLTLRRKQGTQVFFNDDCYMLLPNGSKIKFTETDIGYFLPFYPDFDATHLQAHKQQEGLDIKEEGPLLPL